MSKKIILGVDVGASGIKGALVDMNTGKMTTERFRVPTPSPATPKNMEKAFSQIVEHFDYSGPVGCGFPAIIKKNVAKSASNIDKSWIGVNISETFGKAAGCPVFVTNDADAAGVAEMTFGLGKNKKGVVVLITIGTGLGSAMFMNGKLIPNTEFGHFYLKNQSKVAEAFAADSIRKKKDLSWEEFGKRFNEYLETLERITSPNLIILGGGSSKKFDLFKKKIKIRTEVVPAELKNEAGIIGAATYGYQKAKDLVAS